MPKRKPPPVKRDWARQIGHEWQLRLVSGEVLTALREVSATEARELSFTLPVYSFRYLIPVRSLTGDRDAIDHELARSRTLVGGPENTDFHVFRGDRETEVLVIFQNH